MMEKSIVVEGKTIELTHLEKVMFPKFKIKKSELIDYYLNIAPTALPHYKNRPLTMVRFLHGVENEGFFQKNISDFYPDWVDFEEVEKQGGRVKQALVNQTATLVYIANQDCIEMHVALARSGKLHFPDRIIFDLDPAPGQGFAEIRWAAKQVKQIIEECDLTSFIQTTGSRGVHIVIPIKRSYDFELTHFLSKKIAFYLAAQFPDDLTAEQRKEKRGARVYIDYSRNSYGQGSIGPYSLRAKERAPIATPLSWEELDDENLDAQSYHLRNIFQRLEEKGDPWKEIHSVHQSLSKALNQFAQEK